LQSFYIKLALLISMWAGALFASLENRFVFYIYLFSCIILLAVYFLLPLIRRKDILYLILLVWIQGLIFGGDGQNPLYLYVISCFYLMEMEQELKGRVSGAVLAVMLSLNCYSGYVLYGFPFLLVLAVNGLAGVLIYRLGEANKEYKHIREAYASLLNDFRIHKRRAFQSEKTARAEERTMIAREMHDAVGHKLTALLMQVELLREELPTSSYSIIKAMAAECLEETRKAVRLMQAEELQGISALVHLIKKLESENAVHVHFTAKQGALRLQLSNLKNAVLYRTIQEGLTNAMKYGSTREVFISIGVSPIGHLTFEIKNAFDHNHPIHKGFGLENMSRRLEEAGGKLSILQMNQQFILTGSLPTEELRK